MNPCELISLQTGALYKCSPFGNYIRIRTPYLYPDGDILDLYWQDASETVSDVGETLRWLDGQTISQQRTKRHMQLIADVCATHGVEFIDGALKIRVQDAAMMAMALARLSQACIRVSDLWFTFRTRAFESFPDIVEEFLLSQSVGFSRGETFDGASGKTWRIDFHTRIAERNSLVQTLSTGTRGATRRLTNQVVAACVDLTQLRQATIPTKFISLFDDTIDVWSAEDFRQVEAVSEVHQWSRPDEFYRALAA